MTPAPISLRDMLADLDERLRIAEARLAASTDRYMTDSYRSEIRMLRAQQLQIAGPDTYCIEPSR